MLRSVTMKVCARCIKQKPLTAFYAHKANSDKHDSYCKDCRCELQREMLADPVRRAARAVTSAKYYQNNRDVSRRTGRDAAYRRKYGVSYAEFETLIALAGWRCEICSEPITTEGPKNARTANLDHDHETGVVRGVLCFLCNTAIGKLGDSPQILRNAVAYLERTLSEKKP